MGIDPCTSICITKEIVDMNFCICILSPNEQNPTDLKTRTPSNWQMQSNSKEPPISSMIYTGSPAKKNDVNLIQYIEQVSDNKQKIGKNGVPGSLRMLIYHLKKYKGDRILLKDVDVKYLNGFVRYLSSAISANSGRQKRTLKQSTQHNIFASLKMIIHQAIKDELLTHDPTKSVDSPTTVQSHKEYLTESELKKLIATPSRNEVVKTAFLFCCFTGLRLSDVRNLTWNHITTGSDNKKQLNFRQKKTKIENYIPLSYNAISQLPEQHSSDSVFPLPSDNAIRETLKKWVSDSGIDKHITFHCRRHCALSLSLNLNGLQRLDS